MIVNYLVVAALVGGDPSTPAAAPSLGVRTSTTVSQPTDYQVLPALGISGHKSRGTSDAVAAKYSTGGADWKSTQRVSAQQPELTEPPPLVEPNVEPPASSTEPAAPPSAAPPAVPAAEPPAAILPAPQTAPEAPMGADVEPSIDAELEAINPPAPGEQTAPEGEAALPDHPGMMEQDIYFRSPCVCIYEPWEMATFYANTRSVFLWRNLSKDVPLLVNDTTGAVITSTDDLDLPNKWGQEFLLGYQIDSAHALEVSYMWVADATSSRQFSDAAGGANLPFTPPINAFQDITFQDVHLKSQLWNFELNFINLMRDGTDSPWRNALFLGARIIGIEESIGENSVNINGNLTNGDVRAENALYGGQLGYRGTYRELLPKLNIDFVAKGGVFGNIIDARTSRQFNQGGTQVGFQNSNNGTSGVAQAIEGGIEGVYKLRQNIHLTFGYRALFVARIARASDQIQRNATSFPQLQDNADIFYHGFTAGIRIFWGQRTDPNCRSGCCTPYIVTSGCCP